MSSYVIPLFPAAAASPLPTRDAVAAELSRLRDRVDAGLPGKADKAPPSAAGNLASLDASGNLSDSGATPASIKAAAVAEVVANAPGTMDTLKEIADILGSSQQTGTVLQRILDLESGKVDKEAGKGLVAVDAALATQGAAADAEAVGDALRGGFTPWVCNPATRDGESFSVVFRERIGEYEHWALYLGDQLIEDNYESEINPTGLSFGQFIDVTATRHLITPTKTSQLTNDSGFITSSDLPYALVSSAPVSGDVSLSDRAVNIVSPTVTELPPVWEWSDGLDHGQPVYGVIYDYGDYQDYGWGFQGEGDAPSNTDSLGNYYDFVYDGPDATELSFYDYNTDATIVASLVTQYETDVSSLTLPPAVTGKSRDFMVRLAMPENAAMFSWPSGVEYETEDGQMPDVSEPGVYLLAFTETGADRFALMCRKVQEVE